MCVTVIINPFAGVGLSYSRGRENTPVGSWFRRQQRTACFLGSGGKRVGVPLWKSPLAWLILSRAHSLLCHLDTSCAISSHRHLLSAPGRHRTLLPDAHAGAGPSGTLSVFPRARPSPGEGTFQGSSYPLLWTMSSWVTGSRLQPRYPVSQHMAPV